MILVVVCHLLPPTIIDLPKVLLYVQISLNKYNINIGVLYVGADDVCTDILSQRKR